MSVHRAVVPLRSPALIALLVGCVSEPDPDPVPDPTPSHPCPWFEPQIRALGTAGMPELLELDIGGRADREGRDLPMVGLPLSCIDVLRFEQDAIEGWDIPYAFEMEVTPRGTAQTTGGDINEVQCEVDIPADRWSELDFAFQLVDWEAAPAGRCGDELIGAPTEFVFYTHNRNGDWWGLAPIFGVGCEEAWRREQMDSEDFDNEWRVVELLRDLWDDVVRPACLGPLPDDDTAADDDTTPDDDTPSTWDTYDIFSIDPGTCQVGETTFTLNWDDDAGGLILVIVDGEDFYGPVLYAHGEIPGLPGAPPYTGGTAVLDGPFTILVECFDYDETQLTHWELRVEMAEPDPEGGDDSAGDDDSAAIEPCPDVEQWIDELERNNGGTPTQMHYITMEAQTMVITGFLDYCPGTEK